MQWQPAACHPGKPSQAARQSSPPIGTWDTHPHLEAESAWSPAGPTGRDGLTRAAIPAIPAKMGPV